MTNAPSPFGGEGWGNGGFPFSLERGVLALPFKLQRNAGDMRTLEAGSRQFILARHPFTLTTRDGRRAIGTAAGYFGKSQLSGKRIR